MLWFQQSRGVALSTVNQEIMVRKGGFELLHHVDNTQLVDFASGLKAQMPHNPAAIVRLLYGERAAEEKTAPKRFLSDSADYSLTSAPPIGQGPPLRRHYPSAALLGSVPFGSICRDQSAVAMGFGARLTSAKLALLARSSTASWTRNSEYLF